VDGSEFVLVLPLSYRPLPLCQKIPTYKPENHTLHVRHSTSCRKGQYQGETSLREDHSSSFGARFWCREDATAHACSPGVPLTFRVRAFFCHVPFLAFLDSLQLNDCKGRGSMVSVQESRKTSTLAFPLDCGHGFCYGVKHVSLLEGGEKPPRCCWVRGGPPNAFSDKRCVYFHRFFRNLGLDAGSNISVCTTIPAFRG
jgi:hypothetical protein